MTARRIFIHPLICGGIVLFGAVGLVSAAQDPATDVDAPARAFDLPSDVAEKTLKLFSAQSGRGLIVAAETASNTRTKAVRGTFSAREALARMLAGTGLVAKEDPQNGAFVVHREPPSPNAERAAPIRIRGRPEKNQPPSLPLQNK